MISSASSTGDGMAITPFPHQDPRYGFLKTTAEDEQWMGVCDLESNGYVRVLKYNRRTGLLPGVYPATNRKHWVWAKDELEAFMRLNARRNANL